MSHSENEELLEAMKSVMLPPAERNESNSSVLNRISSTEDEEANLERLFLTPNQRFSEDWLKKLQE